MNAKNGTKAQCGILRFAKYKGAAIGSIESHNERQKEEYASNPDVDTSRSQYNMHLIAPKQKYRIEAERQIAEAECRTRSDSVRMVEALITASPTFFAGKKESEVREYFVHALDFVKAHQGEKTILSAVVHMDEKTPHMHLCFVPLTEDGRLSAKEIVGNKTKLTWWQDEFWKHMVKKYPDLERGESASLTGRTHIPPRLYKEAVYLNAQRDRLMSLLGGVNVFNAKARSKEIEALLDAYIPGVECMKGKLKKYDKAYQELKAENRSLEKKLDANRESTLKRLESNQKLSELEDLRRLVENIPPEILTAYQQRDGKKSRQIQSHPREHE